MLESVQRPFTPSFSKSFNLKKAFAPQRHKEHEGKSVGRLAEAFHQFGLSLYLHKHLNFFVPFVSLWLITAVFGLLIRPLDLHI